MWDLRCLKGLLEVLFYFVLNKKDGSELIEDFFTLNNKVIFNMTTKLATVFPLFVVLLLFTEFFIPMMSPYIAQPFWAFLGSFLWVICLLWIFDGWHCMKIF